MLKFTHLFTADASPIVARTIMPDSRVSEKIDHLKMLNGPPQEIADQVRRSSKSFLTRFHEKHKLKSVYYSIQTLAYQKIQDSILCKAVKIANV